MHVSPSIVRRFVTCVMFRDDEHCFIIIFHNDYNIYYMGSNGKYLKRDHITPLLRGLKWINFNSILRLNEASYMNKHQYVSADSNVKNINFDLRNKVSQRITRNGSDVHIDYRRPAVGQKAVSVSGAKLWNFIPMNIRNSNTIVTFKSHMSNTSYIYRAPITT